MASQSFVKYVSRWYSRGYFCIFTRRIRLYILDSMTINFDDIRPYNDDEVQPTLERLFADKEFLDTITRWRLPQLGLVAPLARPFVRRALKKEMAGIASVSDFQARVETHLKNVIQKTTTHLTMSGLDKLDVNQAYCFISNHRDIAMDSAFVNWCLFRHSMQTLRIAIGDNLLTKPFASDLMRLNKSFIVNRSTKGPREKLKIAKKLSRYIYQSLAQDNNNIWLAQREGRAKDGRDKTNPAIISMLALNRDKSASLADYIKKLHIVPVAISYEFDPCDESKARELYAIDKNGLYEKQEHEDVASIANGITGFKGNVHLAFGEPLTGDYASAEEVAADIDRQILNNYVLHPTNGLAYQILEQRAPEVPVSAQAIPFHHLDCKTTRELFQQRVAACDERWREFLLRAYANPIYPKLQP